MAQMLWTTHKCIQTRTFHRGIIFLMLNRMCVCYKQLVILMAIYWFCTFPKSSNLLRSGLYCFRTIKWVYPQEILFFFFKLLDECTGGHY